MKKVFLTALLFMTFFSFPAFAEELKQVPAEIQVVSTISDGHYSIKNIASMAKASGIKVVVINDRDLMRWEYGIWPFRNIVKRTVENSSIFRYGIKHYLQDIEDARKENPDIVLIAGVESAPYYHWEGNPIHRNLKIKDWHKHLIVVGLEKEKDYKELPLVGNKRGILMPFGLKGLLLVILSLAFITLGAYTAMKEEIDYSDSFGRHFICRSRKCIIMGALLVVTGLVLAVNYYPFREAKFDQYRKDAGALPYQNFINYAINRGALVFWSHPEAEYVGQEGPVAIETRDHSGYILETYDYTGFAIFYEGYEKTGRPGGIWDDALLEYCAGQRKAPPWIIGGLSFEASGNIAEYMKDLRTILLVPALEKKDVLNAMRTGSMYVVRGKRSSDFTLEDFTVTEPSGIVSATMGREAVLEKGPITLKIKGGFASRQNISCQIKVIRDGAVIDILENETPFDITYEDTRTIKGKKSYYRLEITADGLWVETNPIFVRMKEKNE
jgi:hypothetical protein